METRRPKLSKPQGGGGGAKLFWVAGAVLAGCVAAGYLIQNSQQPTAPTQMSDSGLNLRYDPALPVGAPPPKIESRPSSLPTLHEDARVSVDGKKPRMFERKPVEKPIEGKVATDKRWTAMLSAPGEYLARKTYFASPKSLKNFLGDKRRTERYLNHPLTQEVLNSPMLVKLLLRPAIARAFVTSPAMKDDAMVTALAASPLLQRILKSPGVQEALSDPQRVNALTADPQMMEWIGRHPAAVGVLGGLNGRSR